MKSLSLRKLMKIFVAIFSVIILLAASIYIVTTINNFNTEKNQIQSNASNRVAVELQRDSLITNNIGDYISESTTRISNIEEYLKGDFGNYADYVLNQPEYFNWPNQSKDFFIKNPSLNALQVQMSDSKSVFKASSTDTTGKIVRDTKKSDSQMLYCSIINPQQQNVVGIVSAKFNTEALVKNLKQLESGMHMQVIAISDDYRPVFHYTDASVTPEEKQQVDRAVERKQFNSLPGFTIKKEGAVDDQYKVIVIFSNQAMSIILMRRIIYIIAIAIVVLFSLFASFMAIFNRYREQLNTIILTTQAVSDNDLDARIDTNNTRFEDLATLSHSINHMLDEINNNINTIYKLRIAQQEAHMKSLQAQISPHFMANTLEYIRMSALDMGARDLAKVIYNFAALLRSNVGSEVQSTLKKETKIVGNYIYLYQVRFPDKLAYQITVPNELENVKLPKFSLQPLVENYFVHGVDFTRGTNAIEIKARLKDKRVVITVSDNGKTMKTDELKQLNEKLKQPIVGDKSIGLQNVYARMKNYTKNFAMEIMNNSYGGITVELSFDYEI